MEEFRIHPETGKRLRRDARPFTIECKGRSRTVDAPEWCPDGDGDGILIGDDMAGLDRALAELEAEAHDLLRPEEVRAIRRRLRLSQRRAGELLGGGQRSFQKHESGEVLVSKPMAQLLRPLDRDPRRLEELG